MQEFDRVLLRQLWQTLTQRQRRDAISLLALLLLGTVLEMLGIGLVLPVLAVMTSPDPVQQYPALAPLFSLLGADTRDELIPVLMLLLLGGATVKAGFLSFVAWKQMKFVFGLQAELSERLFDGYLRQPYAFHLRRNSAQLLTNVTYECTLFAQTGLGAGIQFLAESLVLTGILLLLLVVEPLGAAAVFLLFGVAGLVFNKVTQRRVHAWGVARQAHEEKRVQHLQQGLGGAKEVKLLGREADFVAMFRTHNRGAAWAGQKSYTLQQIPRLGLELLAVAAIALVVLVMTARGTPLEATLPTLGVFAAAAFRVLPSANRMLSTIQNVRYAMPVIGRLHEEMELVSQTVSSGRRGPLPLREALEVDRVTFRYDAVILPALAEVSLRIPSGYSVGIIGGSGAGKSTLVDLLLGLLTPEEGVIRVDGVDIQTNLRGWQDQIGYVPQTIYLTDDSLRRNIAFGVPEVEIDDDAVTHAVHAARLHQLVDSLPDGLDTPVGERGVRLSGGQRQRIGIARALYHDPPTLVMDEATSSLDIATEQRVMAAVRALRGEKTVIIIAHRLSTVRHCDRIFRLEEGRLVEQGEAADVLKERFDGESLRSDPVGEQH